MSIFQKTFNDGLGSLITINNLNILVDPTISIANAPNNIPLFNSPSSKELERDNSLVNVTTEIPLSLLTLLNAEYCDILLIHTPILSQIDISSIDVILYSHTQAFLSLPYFTRDPLFKGKVFATFSTIQQGEVMINSLLSYNESRSPNPPHLEKYTAPQTPIFCDNSTSGLSLNSKLNEWDDKLPGLCSHLVSLMGQPFDHIYNILTHLPSSNHISISHLSNSPSIILDDQVLSLRTLYSREEAVLSRTFVQGISLGQRLIPKMNSTTGPDISITALSSSHCIGGCMWVLGVGEQDRRIGGDPNSCNTRDTVSDVINATAHNSVLQNLHSAPSVCPDAPVSTESSTTSVLILTPFSHLSLRHPQTIQFPRVDRVILLEHALPFLAFSPNTAQSSVLTTSRRPAIGSHPVFSTNSTPFDSLSLPLPPFRYSFPVFSESIASLASHILSLVTRTSNGSTHHVILPSSLTNQMHDLLHHVALLIKPLLSVAASDNYKTGSSAPTLIGPRLVLLGETMFLNVKGAGVWVEDMYESMYDDTLSVIRTKKVVHFDHIDDTSNKKLKGDSSVSSRDKDRILVDSNSTSNFFSNNAIRFVYDKKQPFEYLTRVRYLDYHSERVLKDHQISPSETLTFVSDTVNENLLQLIRKSSPGSGLVILCEDAQLPSLLTVFNGQNSSHIMNIIDTNLPAFSVSTPPTTTPAATSSEPLPTGTTDLNSHFTLSPSPTLHTPAFNACWHQTCLPTTTYMYEPHTQSSDTSLTSPSLTQLLDPSYHSEHRVASALRRAFWRSIKPNKSRSLSEPNLNDNLEDGPERKKQKRYESENTLENSRVEDVSSELLLHSNSSISDVALMSKQWNEYCANFSHTATIMCVPLTPSFNPLRLMQFVSSLKASLLYLPAQYLPLCVSFSARFPTEERLQVAMYNQVTNAINKLQAAFLRDIAVIPSKTDIPLIEDLSVSVDNSSNRIKNDLSRPYDGLVKLGRSLDLPITVVIIGQRGTCDLPWSVMAYSKALHSHLSFPLHSQLHTPQSLTSSSSPSLISSQNTSNQNTSTQNTSSQSTSLSLDNESTPSQLPSTHNTSLPQASTTVIGPSVLPHLYTTHVYSDLRKINHPNQPGAIIHAQAQMISLLTGDQTVDHSQTIDDLPWHIAAKIGMMVGLGDDDSPNPSVATQASLPLALAPPTNISLPTYSLTQLTALSSKRWGQTVLMPPSLEPTTHCETTSTDSIITSVDPNTVLLRGNINIQHLLLALRLFYPCTLLFINGRVSGPKMGVDSDTTGEHNLVSVTHKDLVSLRSLRYNFALSFTYLDPTCVLPTHPSDPSLILSISSVSSETKQRLIDCVGLCVVRLGFPHGQLKDFSDENAHCHDKYGCIDA